MCRLNINKCHSCQTAGNSNFTLFRMVYFFQRLLQKDGITRKNEMELLATLFSFYVTMPSKMLNVGCSRLGYVAR
jgi:hypothetical protein